MKILSGKQIRDADAFTIANEPIASIQLMERAAIAFVKTFISHYLAPGKVMIFCGPGNNGGDGLAIARLLHHEGYHPNVFIVDTGNEFSMDFKINQERLKEIHAISAGLIRDINDIPEIPAQTIVIDALFGTGLSRPVDGIAAGIINLVNHSGARVVAVDMPSGLYADSSNAKEDIIVKAERTFTFQCPKLSFFYCSNASYTGQWEALDIGIRPEFIEQAETSDYYIDNKIAKSILKPRQRCGHKGTYGHALIWAGAYGKMGAAVMSADACLHAGAGLTTAFIPGCGYTIMQTVLPEVMVATDADPEKLSSIPEIENFSAIGMGPGVGTHLRTVHALTGLLKEARDMPVVIDADALNIIAAHPKIFPKLPKQCILTPHPKEFERLAGAAANDWERQKMASEFAKKQHCVLVLKGAYTSVNMPDGKTYYNATGNPGMAKGGSGDVLTGILTALLAQNYPLEDAAILGVYLHGLAGDFAAKKFGMWSMTSRDLIGCLGKAFGEVEETI